MRDSGESGGEKEGVSEWNGRERGEMGREGRQKERGMCSARKREGCD